MSFQVSFQTDCDDIKQSGLLMHITAHRGDGKRFVVRSHELSTAFLQLEERTREKLF